MNWTVEKVKQKLPSVPVNHNGTICNGVVQGRKLKFPVIYYFSDLAKQPIQEPHVISAAWETIADVLNNDGSIKI